MDKYSKRPVDEWDNPNDDVGMSSHWNQGHKFRCGSAIQHMRYLAEMSRRHPIMYWLWFRWWIPTLLHEDERKRLNDFCIDHEFRPYWADFALYRPVQFLVFLFLRRCVQTFAKIYVKLLSAPIKAISRILKVYPSRKDNTDNVRRNDKIVE